eukprot:COSAG01_NODE_903_length_12848_cov_7.966899_1_plen_51_part_10
MQHGSIFITSIRSSSPWPGGHFSRSAGQPIKCGCMQCEMTAPVAGRPSPGP